MYWTGFTSAWVLKCDKVNNAESIGERWDDQESVGGWLG